MCNLLRQQSTSPTQNVPTLPQLLVPRMHRDVAPREIQLPHVPKIFTFSRFNNPKNQRPRVIF